jgi:hypothetical protein
VRLERLSEIRHPLSAGRRHGPRSPEKIAAITLARRVKKRAAMKHEQSRTSMRVWWLVFGVWAALAVGMAASGVISVDMPRPLVALSIWIPTLGFVLLYFRSPALKAAVLALDPRVPILYHLVRVGFGALFLSLYARGAMPGEFALTAGPGDILAGAGALVAAACVPIRSRLRHNVVFAWNLIALADILLVFVTAQRIVIFGDGPRALSSLVSFPLSLVPCLVVPLILVTHFIVFVQASAARKRLASQPGSPLQAGTTLG